jgi:cytidylate kinase
MGDLLYEYMNQRFSDVTPEEHSSKHGPVITISRAAGCTARKLSEGLAKKLNQNRKGDQWEVISKEILHHSAEILNMNPDKLKSIFEPKDRNLFDEVIQTFISGDYQLEKKMIKTVINVIHKFGAEGHKIIIGRAANIICYDIPDSLHIRIDAPLKWRIEQIEKTKKISKEEALNFIKQTDINRKNFRKSIKKDIHERNYHDVTINQASFSDDDIIDIIVDVMKKKKLL